MKILNTVTIFPKISETFILDLMLRMIRKGHDVSLLSRYRQENLKSGERDPFIPSGALQNKLAEKTHYFSASIGQNRGCYRIKPAFRETAVAAEIIVAHFADTPAEMAMKLSLHLKKPYVFFAHARELFVDPCNKRLAEAAKNASFICVPTVFNRLHLLELLGDSVRPKLEIIRYGIDLKHFKPGDKGVVSNHVVTSIGRLVEKKGFQYTIQAFKRIAANYPGAVLKIIGDGPQKSELIRLTRQLGIEERVQFRLFQDHSGIRKELADSNVFILPSITAENGDGEGLPVSILEAMAMGVPVVSTYHKGIPEAVVDGKSGFLAREKDIEYLSVSLDRLLASPALCREMGRQGRVKVEDEFNQVTVTEKFLKLLEQAISSYSTCCFR